MVPASWLPEADAGYRRCVESRAPSHVIGRYASPEAARAAVIRVEALAFDGDAIEIIDLTDGAMQRETASGDAEAVGGVARQAGAGATIGAVAGAAAGMVTGVVTGDVGTALVVGAAGVAGGGVVGGLAGTYAGLPVNEAAWTTYELDPDDPHPITVRVRVGDPHEADLARTALRG
jgi:hypothetical protein